MVKLIAGETLAIVRVFSVGNKTTIVRWTQ